MAGISVHVRVRPTTHQSTWATADTCLYPTKGVPGQNEATTQQPFVFNKVHSAAATNESIFHSVEPLVHAAFDGRNVTVMAYGQTGSGKTHTMVGGHDDKVGSKDRGIIPRVAQLLLSLKGGAGQEGTTIDASCIEIYNEKVLDLMDAKQEVQLRDVALDGTVTFERVGIAINDYQDYLQMAHRYEASRAKNVTDLNAHSSRSHMMLCFTITRPNKVPSSIYLVDLAGSESSAKAHTEGLTQREGGHINRSLLALGNVVTALVEGRLPVYRESKLTRLLRGCLQGGFTFMITTVNPDPGNHEQTVTALKFAQRAMKMKADPTQLLTMVPLEGVEYVEHLKTMMQTYKDRSNFAYEEAMSATYYAVAPLLNDKAGVLNKQAQEAMAEWQLARVALVARERLRYVMTVKKLQSRGSQTRDKRQLASTQMCEQRDLVDQVTEQRRRLEDEKQEMEFRVQEKRSGQQTATNQAEYRLKEKRSQIYAAASEVLDEELSGRESILAEQVAQRAMSMEHFVKVMRKSHFNGGNESSRYHVYSVGDAGARRAKTLEFKQKLHAERDDTQELKNAYEMLHGTALSQPMDNDSMPHADRSNSMSQATSFGGENSRHGSQQRRQNPDDDYSLTDEGFDQKLLALEHQRQYLEDEMVKERYSGRHTADQRPSGNTPQYGGHRGQPLRSPTPGNSPYHRDTNNARAGADDDLILKDNGPTHHPPQGLRPLPSSSYESQVGSANGGHHYGTTDVVAEAENFGIGAGDVSLYLEEETPPGAKKAIHTRHLQQQQGGRNHVPRTGNPSSLQRNNIGSKKDLLAASSSMDAFQNRFLNPGSNNNSRMPSTSSSALAVPPSAPTAAMRSQISQQRSQAQQQNTSSSYTSTTRPPLGSYTPSRNNVPSQPREKRDTFSTSEPQVGQKRSSDQTDASPSDQDQQSLSKAELMAMKRREAAEKAKVTRARNKEAKEALDEERARVRKEKMDRVALSKSLSNSNSPVPGSKFGTPSSAKSGGRGQLVQYRDTVHRDPSDNVQRSLEF